MARKKETPAAIDPYLAAKFTCFLCEPTLTVDERVGTGAEGVVAICGDGGLVIGEGVGAGVGDGLIRLEGDDGKEIVGVEANGDCGIHGGSAGGKGSTEGEEIGEKVGSGVGVGVGAGGIRSLLPICRSFRVFAFRMFPSLQI